MHRKYGQSLQTATLKSINITTTHIMSRRIFVIVALMSLVAIKTMAQWDAQFSDYTALKSFYNPAVSGTDGKLNVSAAYSLQMVGYDNAPATMYAGADMPIYFLSPRHGAGVSFYNDDIGIFKTQKINLQYAYNVQLSKRTRVAIGVQGSMLKETIDPSNIKLEDGADPAFPSSQVDGNAFDLGAGIYVYNPKYWAGISAQHLMAPTIEMGQTYEISIDRVYYLMAGGNIKLKNTLLTLQPSFLVQTDLQTWREDVQCKLAYEYDGKKFYGGLGYSPNTSFAFLLGGDFHGITLGYSYQMYTSGIGMQNGSHELVLGYQTELDLFKKGRNRHKSVRFL